MYVCLQLTGSDMFVCMLRKAERNNIKDSGDILTDVCMYLFHQVVIPWTSPVSLTALVWPRTFVPDKELSRVDVSIFCGINMSVSLIVRPDTKGCQIVWTIIQQAMLDHIK